MVSNLFREGGRRVFGWDWFAWNTALAATPACFLWWGLDKVKIEMQEKAKSLRDEQELEKTTIQAQQEKLQEEEKKTRTLEERVADIEAQIQRLFLAKKEDRPKKDDATPP